MKSWIAAITSGAFAAQMLCAGAAFAGNPSTSPTVDVGTVTNADSSGNAPSANAKPDAGGFAPCLMNCYLGPRVGTEYNEGRNFSTMEILQLVASIGRIILAAQAYGGKTMTEYAKENTLDSRPIPPPHPRTAVTEKGGITSCLVACYFGPRVAFERNEGRHIRTYEILAIIPIVNLIVAILGGLEAYNGKTMTQIAKDEGLDS